MGFSGILVFEKLSAQGIWLEKGVIWWGDGNCETAWSSDPLILWPTSNGTDGDDGGKLAIGTIFEPAIESPTTCPAKFVNVSARWTTRLLYTLSSLHVAISRASSPMSRFQHILLWIDRRERTLPLTQGTQCTFSRWQDGASGLQQYQRSSKSECGHV